MTSVSRTPLVTSAVALALCAVLAGCGTHKAPPLNAREVAAASHFRDYTVYWVGRSFEGVALTGTDNPASFERSVGWRAYYGDCKSHEGPLGAGGCLLPLEISTLIYKPHVYADLGPHRKLRIRGVPAVVYDHGNSIELYSGRLAIDVSGDSPRRALRAAQRLRPFNRPGTLAPLPPPRFKPGVVPPPAKPRRTNPFTCFFDCGPNLGRPAVAAHRARPAR